MDKETPALMTNFQPVKSSNIESAAYDGQDKCQVRFKTGAVYEYSGVFNQLWDRFERTFQDDDASSGAFFSEQIKPLKFTRVE